MQRLAPYFLAGLIAIVAIAVEGSGQAGPLPPKTSRVITLGTVAGPNPNPHQAQPSNLLIVNGTFYVIDAGDGIARRLAKAGIRIREIGTIFLTHLHDDHTSGLVPLMSVAWDQNRVTPINVYGPPRTEELVNAAGQFLNIGAEIRIADGGRSIPITELLFGHDVGTRLIYQDANIKVTSAENSHFAFHSGLATGKHKSYAYRFETPDRVIVFTGDTGASDAVTELARGADLLVTESNSFQDRMQIMMKSGEWQAMTAAERAGIEHQSNEGHMTPEMLGSLATRANVKTVVLSHLTYRRDGDYTQRANEVKKYFSGQVLVAKDLMEF